MVQIRILSRISGRGRWGVLAGALFFGSTGLFAQTDVANFKVPDISEDGIMVSMMTGDRARLFPGKPMEITNFTIEFYEADGKTVKMRITSPFCEYETKSNAATSEDKVKIEGPTFTITGKGYIFEATHSRMKIEENVRVVLKNLNLKTSNPESKTP